MLRGEESFTGAPVLRDIVIITSILTVICETIEDSTVNVPIRSIVRTVACWPSIMAASLAAALLWSSRHVERVLGLLGFGIYLLYHFIVYVPFYVVMHVCFGYSKRFSLVLFIPCSMVFYLLWRFPSKQLLPYLRDKMLLLVVYLGFLSTTVYYGLFALVSSIIGYVLWTYDLLFIKRVIKKCLTEPFVDDNSPIP